MQDCGFSFEDSVSWWKQEFYDSMDDSMDPRRRVLLFSASGRSCAAIQPSTPGSSTSVTGALI